MIEQPIYDKTPYSAEELIFLRYAYPLFEGTWYEFSENGISIDSSIGRFDRLYGFLIDDITWIVVDPATVLTHKPILTDMAGSVILTGLGIGLGAFFAIHNPAITSVEIVEIEQRAISVMKSRFAFLNDPKISIVQADANTYSPASKFDHAFIDHTMGRPSTGMINRANRYAKKTNIWYDVRISLLNDLSTRGDVNG